MLHRQMLSMIFLMFASASLIQGASLPYYVNALELPKLGQYVHHAVSSSANAAATAYDNFSTYIKDLRGHFGKDVVIPAYPPRYGAFGRLINVQPSLAGQILTRPVNIASKAATAASSAANAASTGNYGNYGILGRFARTLPA